MEEQNRINDIPEEKENGDIETRDDITDKIPLTTSITDLGLTKKVSNLLQRVGINDLEEDY